MEIKNAKNISRSKNWKVILYGKPGVGKTSAIKNLKGKTLVIDLDNSSRVLAGTDVDIIEFDRVHPEEFMETLLKELPEAIKNYDNLVIDNVSSFEKDWFVEKGRNSHNGISNELQDYSQWTNYFARVMTMIYMLPDINIVTTAWENNRQVTNANGQEFNQFAPQLRESVRDGLLGLADVVGRMAINPESGNRGVFLEGNDGMFAKNRLDNRKATSIEQLFNWGDVNVQASSVSTDAGKSSKTETK
ncbi:AAA family ATPase [Lactobacillus terrae]|uniref:AAA family ATPase n=1 Tax=Lactobacillus terrae TaxID=2269374 RepID=UPI000C1B62E3|nr:AAA family ATPase [Lactobacillus terrae]